MAAANVLQLPVERKKCTESEIIQEKSHLADPNLAHHSTEKNNRERRKKKKKWTCLLSPFGLFQWTGNSLRKPCGLWSSSFTDLAFSLQTLLRFTIENQLNLWRACVLGRDCWRG